MWQEVGDTQMFAMKYKHSDRLPRQHASDSKKERKFLGNVYWSIILETLLKQIVKDDKRYIRLLKNQNKVQYPFWKTILDA